MKVLIVLALAVASVSAFGKPTATKIHPRDRPVISSRKLGIINGYKASDGQFPYVVGIELPIDLPRVGWCGGSIISQEWVLTTAHCLCRPSSKTLFPYVKLFFGSVIRLRPRGLQTVFDASFVVHSDFDPKWMVNDIGLIKISPVNFNEYINKIQLPPIAPMYSDYVGQSTVTAGWGWTTGKPFAAEDLQYANFKIIPNEPCSRRYGGIPDSNICTATTFKRSTCFGDSGGPLVTHKGKLQIGITSYSHSCEDGDPDVFTRVTSFLDWIKQHTGISY